MARTDPRDRRKPEAPRKDWEDQIDEDIYREPQEGQPPERQRGNEPGRPGTPSEQPRPQSRALAKPKRPVAGSGGLPSAATLPVRYPSAQCAAGLPVRPVLS